jgi:hypothetical protein
MELITVASSGNVMRPTRPCPPKGDASPHHGAMIEGGAKLVQIDLASNRVSVYPLGKDLASASS